MTHRPFEPFVARTTVANPPTALSLITACDTMDHDTLRALLTDPELREAIEVASPAFSEQTDRFLNGDMSDRRRHRLIESLHGYGMRMLTRATPLGTFAAIGLGRTTNDASWREDRKAPRIRRVVRPSASCCVEVCKIVETHDDALLDLMVARSRSVYFRDGSLIALGGAHADAGGFAVTDRVRLITDVLTSFEDWLPAHIVVADVAKRAGRSIEEAERFVVGMIRHGLLVTELSKVPVSSEPFAVLLEVVTTRAKDASARWDRWIELANSLLSLRDEIAAIDWNLPAAPSDYQKVRRNLAALGVTPDLHVDSVAVKPVALEALAPLDSIYRACLALTVLCPQAEHPAVRAAVQWLSDRYSDTHIVRLSEMFLPGSGLDISRIPRSRGAVGDRAYQAGGAWRELVKRGVALNVGDVDLASVLGAAALEMSSRVLPAAFIAHLAIAPSSLSPTPTTLRTINSGLQLLGRFSVLDHRLADILRAYLLAEEGEDPEVVRVEVTCPCIGRAQNIAVRPALRAASIDFGPPSSGLDILGRPIVSLPVQDILARVMNGQIQLFSERLGKRVIPSVSTAMVYHRCAYPAAAFLIVLSGVLGRARRWDWGELDRMRALPRIRVGEVVLSPRQWTLFGDDIDALVSDGARGGLDLPRWASVGGRDEPLTIDLRSSADRRRLRAMLPFGAVSALRIREAWSQEPAGDSAVDGAATQAVIPFLQTSHSAVTRPTAVPQQRRWPIVVTSDGPGYGPGSRWASLKVYGRPASLDRLLADLRPTIDAGITDGAVRRWFFVRYSDPGHHLRLRFTGIPHRLWGEFVPGLWKALEVLDLFWDRVVADEYRPETARYGGPSGLAVSERLFFADSRYYAGLNEVPDEERVVIAATNIDYLLRALGFSTVDRRRVVKRAERSRAFLHGVESARVEAGDRMRRTGWTGPEPESLAAADFAIAEWQGAVDSLAPRLVALSAGASEYLEEVTLSLIHMHCNRAFVTDINFAEVSAASMLRRAYDRDFALTQRAETR